VTDDRNYVVNCYAPAGRANPVNDQFPVATYVGGKDAVVQCVADLLGNPHAGVSRAEIVISPKHPAWGRGQAPQEITLRDLTREMILEAARQSGLVRTTECCGVGEKFCESDVWRGNLEGFARALVRIAKS